MFRNIDESPIGKGYRFLVKNIRPDIFFIGSFFFVILIGSLLLCLPFANKESIAYVDALFTATTATCVTGLMTKTLAQQFTFFGQFVVLLLIQIGGLGLMTIVSVFILFAKNKLGFQEKVLLKDALNKEGFDNISSFIIAIVRFTFAVEGIGFIIYFLHFSKMMSFFKALWTSLFLAISAFCNAGIDPLGATSLNLFATDFVVNFNTCFLIIAGGLGFSVWFDLYDSIVRNKDPRPFYKKLSIHSKAVLLLTALLIFSEMFFIFFQEYSGVLKDFNFIEKLLVSFFNSVTLRTAGFTTVDYSLLRRATVFVMIPYMLIGGSPGGTAGGFKSTTFMLLLLSLYAQFNQESHLHVFKREVQASDYNKATTIVLTYFLYLFIALALLLTFENATFLSLFFEAASAIGTVGLTVGITSSLNTIGKVIIIALMFIGRIGPATIFFSLRGHKTKHDESIRYPHANILIG